MDAETQSALNMIIKLLEKTNCEKKIKLVHLQDCLASSGLGLGLGLVLVSVSIFEEPPLFPTVGDVSQSASVLTQTPVDLYTPAKPNPSRNYMQNVL